MSAKKQVFSRLNNLRVADTATHEVKIGEVHLSEPKGVLTINMIRRKNLSFEADFLGTAVIVDGNEVWSFKKTDFDGMALMALAQDEIVIAFIKRGCREVSSVLPVSSFLKKEPDDILTLLEMKKAAAEYLGRPFEISSTELMVQKRVIEMRQHQEEEAAAAKKEARRQEREVKINEIVSRPTIDGTTIDGFKRFGHPCVGDEWKVLRHKTLVMLVESYDQDSGECGKILSSFKVVRKPGKPAEQGNPAKIVSENAPGTQKMPTVIRKVMFEKDGSFFDARVYLDMAAIRRAREMGLNGGTYVIPEDTMVNGRATIFSVRAEEIVTVGNRVVMSV